MIIKAIFPAGATELTVHGLHQWNYGQQLEIAAEALPAMVEVHFACMGMETAVVRSCAVIDGKVTAAIPDRCLEQTTPVVAWVYAIGDTFGKTVLTVKMPIITRVQPQPAPTVPEDVCDRYTEAVGAMNELVEEHRQVAANAEQKIKADLQQDISSGALVVGAAKTDALGYPLVEHLRGRYDDFTKYVSGRGVAGGIMALRVVMDAQDMRIVTEVGGRFASCYSPVFYWEAKGTYVPVRLKFTHVGSDMYTITVETLVTGLEWAEDGPDIYYQHLSKKYPVG